MTHNKKTEFRIVPAANGWAVYTHDFTHPGLMCPTYVFNDSFSLGRAICNLAEHGTIEPPSAPAFVGSGEPGDPVTCPQGISHLIESERPF